MATIQIRDIPEHVYERVRRRARAHGQSIQAYMREQVIDMAEAPTKAEVAAGIEAALAEYGPTRGGADSIVADVHADRR
jgi:plasmid stability protein